MIIYIEGKVIDIQVSDREKVLDVMTNSGVGYRVNLALNSKSYLPDQECKLFTYLVVREDSQTLYGFEDKNSREFFELLISVSGIGPKTALAVLSTYDLGEIIDLIVNEDDKALTKVSGLGSKGAKRLVLELSGKVEGFGFVGKGKRADMSGNPVLVDLEEALKNLGFRGEELDRKMSLARGVVESSESLDLEGLLREVIGK